jgi:hypothetical protein
MARTFDNLSARDPHLTIEGNSVDRGRGLLTIAAALVAMLGAAMSAALLTLPNLNLPSSGLDPSWRYAMEFAYRTGLVFGRDFSFTSGPLSFVYTHLFGPQTFGWIVAGFGVCLAAYLAAIWWSPVRSAAVLGLLLMVAAAAPLYQDVVYFSLSLMVFLLALNGRAPRVVVAVLAAGLALPCLAKFNIFVIALPLLGLADCAALLGRRRFYAVTPIWTAAFVGFYVASGQPITALGEFLLASLDVANGYGQTMGNFWWSAHQTAIVLMSLAVLGGAALLTGRQPDRILRWAALLGLAWYLFLVFKSGNVRAGHQFITWGALTAAGCLLFMFPIVSDRVRRWTPLLSALYALLCLLSFQYFIGEFDLQHIVRKRVAQLATQVAAVSGWRTPAANYRNLLAQRKASEDLLARDAPAGLIGKVGVVPYDFSEVIAAGYDFAPQPSLQQYNSYTPRIRELDRRYFAGDRRPDNLLFRLATIDDHYRTIELGPSLPQILSGYDFAGQKSALPGSPLLLMRRAVPRKIERQELVEKEGFLDSWISVPEVRTGALVLAIRLNERLRGKLLALLYKQSSFELDLKFTNGETVKSRLLPNLVADGFMVIAPDASEESLFSDIDGLSTPAPRNSLVAIRVHPLDLAKTGFAPNLTVAVSSVSMAGTIERPESVHDPMFSLRAARVMETTGFRLVDPATMLAHSPTRVVARMTSGKRLNGEFGIFDTAWQQGDPAPVRFRIVTATGNRRDVLLERTLDPKHEVSDRGPQSFSVELPPAVPNDAVEIEFETGPGSSWGWSYWSKLNYAPTSSN